MLLVTCAYIPSPAEASSSPKENWHQCTTATKKKHAPLGLNLITLTAAECLLSVERYSTRGGWGAKGPESGVFEIAVDDDGGMMFGRTNHIFGKMIELRRVFKIDWNVKTHSDVIIFAASCQPVAQG